MKATAKDLRFFSKELIETSLRGEEVVITYRGKPVVKLVPIRKGKSVRSERHDLFGIWKDRKEIDDVTAYVRKIREGRLNDFD
ncbi:type II toxin-antitoxin system Phd/YefM family antitoxin [Caldithrix abyssi]